MGLLEAVKLGVREDLGSSLVARQVLGVPLEAVVGHNGVKVAAPAAVETREAAYFDVRAFHGLSTTHSDVSHALALPSAAHLAQMFVVEGSMEDRKVVAGAHHTRAQQADATRVGMALGSQTWEMGVVHAARMVMQYSGRRKGVVVVLDP